MTGMFELAYLEARAMQAGSCCPLHLTLLYFAAYEGAFKLTKLLDASGASAGKVIYLPSLSLPPEGYVSSAREAEAENQNKEPPKLSIHAGSDALQDADFSKKSGTKLQFTKSSPSPAAKPPFQPDSEKASSSNGDSVLSRADTGSQVTTQFGDQFRFHLKIQDDYQGAHRPAKQQLAANNPSSSLANSPARRTSVGSTPQKSEDGRSITGSPDKARHRTSVRTSASKERVDKSNNLNSALSASDSGIQQVPLTQVHASPPKPTSPSSTKPAAMGYQMETPSPYSGVGRDSLTQKKNPANKPVLNNPGARRSLQADEHPYQHDIPAHTPSAVYKIKDVGKDENAADQPAGMGLVVINRPKDLITPRKTPRTPRIGCFPSFTKCIRPLMKSDTDAPAPVSSALVSQQPYHKRPRAQAEPLPAAVDGRISANGNAGGANKVERVVNGTQAVRATAVAGTVLPFQEAVVPGFEDDEDVASGVLDIQDIPEVYTKPARGTFAPPTPSDSPTKTPNGHANRDARTASAAASRNYYSISSPNKPNVGGNQMHLGGKPSYGSGSPPASSSGSPTKVSSVHLSTAVRDWNPNPASPGNNVKPGSGPKIPAENHVHLSVQNHVSQSIDKTRQSMQAHGTQSPPQTPLKQYMPSNSAFNTPSRHSVQSMHTTPLHSANTPSSPASSTAASTPSKPLLTTGVPLVTTEKTPSKSLLTTGVPLVTVPQVLPTKVVPNPPAHAPILNASPVNSGLDQDQTKNDAYHDLGPQYSIAGAPSNSSSNSPYKEYKNSAEGQGGYVHGPVATILESSIANKAAPAENSRGNNFVKDDDYKPLVNVDWGNLVIGDKSVPGVKSKGAGSAGLKGIGMC